MPRRVDGLAAHTVVCREGADGLRTCQALKGQRLALLAFQAVRGTAAGLTGDPRQGYRYGV